MDKNHNHAISFYSYAAKTVYVSNTGGGAILASIFCSCGNGSKIVPKQIDSSHIPLPVSNLGTWSAVAQMPGEARALAVAFSLNGYGYVGTGYDSLQSLNDFYRFAPATNVWSRIADFPGNGRYGAVAFTVNGKAYVTTGGDFLGQYYTDMYEYDPQADTWTQKANFPGVPRRGAVAFGIGNTGYVGFGQSNGNLYLKDFYAYDAATDSWSNLSNPINKKAGVALFVYNDTAAYMVSGLGINGLQWDVDRFAPASSLQWSILNPVVNMFNSYDSDYTTIERTAAVSFVIGDTAYLTAGSISTASPYSPDASFMAQFVTTTWAYNIAADRWQQHPSFPAGTIGAVSFTVNNMAYVGTGFQPNPDTTVGGLITTAGFYQFNPTASAR